MYVIWSTGDITIPNLIAMAAIFKIDMRLHLTNRLPVKAKVDNYGCLDFFNGGVTISKGANIRNHLLYDARTCM